MMVFVDDVAERCLQVFGMISTLLLMLLLLMLLFAGDVFADDVAC